MRESVYDLLNDMDHQPKEYTAEKVSKKDIRKWKKAFDAKRHSPAKRWIKYAAAAAVLYSCRPLLQLYTVFQLCACHLDILQ